MKQTTLLLITACIITSCSGVGSGDRKGASFAEINEKAESYSSAYFARRLGNAKVFTDEDDGLVTITNDVTGYKIDNGKIVTGLIDEDEREDAIVPFYTLSGKSIMGYYHMILLASADTFVVSGTVSDIFSVHEIKDRKILAEVSTVSPDSPGFGCDECREVVRYILKNGNLEKEK